VFDKIWAKYLDLETKKEWQGILCLKIGETLAEYEKKNNIKVIEKE